ncbi:MAG TPA: translation initiation factor IF-3, partial [Pyrinomonadaceae bacterium]
MPQVRVIGEDGEQFGVLDTRDAIRRAREQGMDLVEVAPNAEPPVCKIIDFGKFQYEAKKKANEAKKKQVVITVKEIKFRPGTDV